MGETSKSGVSGTTPAAPEETPVSLDGEQHELSTPEDECATGGESQ